MVSNVRASIGVGLLLGLTLSLLILMSTASAQAQNLECQTQITELRDATVAAKTSFTNENDWHGLLGKVDSASAKLTEGKTADALKNLDSILTKVSTLEAQNKLGEAEANALTVEATQARECVAGPQAQVPTTTA